MGMIIVSSSSSKECVSRDIGLFQNSMTLGQLTAPLLGSIAAIILGYKGAFIFASALVFTAFGFCFLYVKNITIQSKKITGFGLRVLSPKMLICWGLCFTTTIQLMFLPSVLPNVFHQFHIEESVALKSAG
jgi:hypothetical protein